MSLTKCHPRLCPTCTCPEPHTCSDEKHINHSPHSRGQCAPTCLQLPQGWCFQKGGWPWNTPGLSPPSWCSPHSAPCCSGSPGTWKTKITTITKTFIREGRGPDNTQFWLLFSHYLFMSGVPRSASSAFSYRQKGDIYQNQSPSETTLSKNN